MRQFAIELDNTDNNWVDLKTTSFKEILVLGRSLTSSQYVTFFLAVGRNSLADRTTAPSLPKGIHILRGIKIPYGATFCYSDLDVSNIKKELGSDKNDKYTILVRCEDAPACVLVTT